MPFPGSRLGLKPIIIGGANQPKAMANAGNTGYTYVLSILYASNTYYLWNANKINNDSQLAIGSLLQIGVIMAISGMQHPVDDTSPLHQATEAGSSHYAPHWSPKTGIVKTNKLPSSAVPPADWVLSFEAFEAYPQTHPAARVRCIGDLHVSKILRHWRFKTRMTLEGTTTKEQDVSLQASRNHILQPWASPRASPVLGSGRHATQFAPDLKLVVGLGCP